MKGPVISGQIGLQTWDKLFGLDKMFMPQPHLVDTYTTSSDSLTWTFKLRDGLSFHDGTPLTSKEAIGSWKRYADFAPLGKLTQTFVSDLSAPDNLTFTFKLKEPTGLLIDALATMQAVMVEKDYTIPVAEGTKQIVGTGPYKFKSWTPGDRLVLERWDGYKPSSKPSSYQVGFKAAYVDQIMYVEVPDQATRVAALETGEVHFLDEFKADFAARVKKNPDLRLYPVPPGNNLIFVFNHTHPPFSDLRVRQAVRLAYPNEDALRVAVGDPSLWKLCPSMFMCGSRWESSVAQSLYNKQDMKGGIQLVKDAGLAGTTVRLMVGEDMPVLPDASLVTRALLEGLGFKVQYQSMDWATLAQRRTKPDEWEVFHTWGSRDWSLLNPMSNVAITPKGWWNQYQDTTGKMTDLRNQFARAVTFDQQKKIVDQMTQVFWEDLPVVIMGQFFPVMASRKEVQGYEAYPDPVFYNLWLEK